MNLTGNSERPSTPSPRYASAPPPSAPATSSSLPIAVTEPENARRASDTCRVTHFGASECVRAAPRQPHPHPRHRLPPVSSPACPAPRLPSRLCVSRETLSEGIAIPFLSPRVRSAQIGEGGWLRTTIGEPTPLIGQDGVNAFLCLRSCSASRRVKSPIKEEFVRRSSET